jgi:hypothetical protein
MIAFLLWIILFILCPIVALCLLPIFIGLAFLKTTIQILKELAPYVISFITVVITIYAPWMYKSVCIAALKNYFFFKKLYYKLTHPTFIE